MKNDPPFLDTVRIHPLPSLILPRSENLEWEPGALCVYEKISIDSVARSACTAT